MLLPSSTIDFIQKHIREDVRRLVLNASRYPDIDIPFAVTQIAARQQIKDKLPSWYENTELIFPAKIAAEQCSSEQTAIYKQRLIDRNTTVCDLTGGLGIDSYSFSQKAEKVIYIERFPEYCAAAIHNFSVLKAENLEVLQGDSREIVGELQGIDVFYLDPARRGESNKRVFALTDCEPDLTVWVPQLLEKSPKVIAKISPMADIRQTLRLLPQITGIHVLSVKNECKELLLIMENQPETNEPEIVCWNMQSNRVEEIFSFTLQEERDFSLQLSEEVQTYLYEPNASILKAGAFKSILRTGVQKLHMSSHLYTSSHLIADFPGRIFQVDKIYPFKGKMNLNKEIPKAHLSTRNFPLPVAELRKRIKVQEGGEIYLFATTLKKGEKVIIQTHKVS